MTTTQTLTWLAPDAALSADLEHQALEEDQAFLEQFFAMSCLLDALNATCDTDELEIAS